MAKSAAVAVGPEDAEAVQNKTPEAAFTLVVEVAAAAGFNGGADAGRAFA